MYIKGYLDLGGISGKIKHIMGLAGEGAMVRNFILILPNKKKFWHVEQVFIYRLFWKSKDQPTTDPNGRYKKPSFLIQKAVSGKRLKLCADFKRTGHQL